MENLALIKDLFQDVLAANNVILYDLKFVNENKMRILQVRIMNEEYRKKLGRNEEDCINNWERAYKFPPATAKSKIIDITQEIGLLGKVSFTAVVEPVVLKNKTNAGLMPLYSSQIV